MLKKWYIYFLMIALLIVGGSAHTDQGAQHAGSNTDWQTSARQSVDNCKLARGVILDALYARKLGELSLAYERLYQAKTSSDVRLANYVHAAILAACLPDVDYGPKHKACLERAKTLLANAIQPEVERDRRMHDPKAIMEERSDAEFYKPMRKQTTNADVWLDWGLCCTFGTGNPAQAELAYKKALKLDSGLAEAYWGLADLTVQTYNPSYYQKHGKEAIIYLDKAETLESKLHPLIVSTRGYMALNNPPSRENYKLALQYFEEYLRLWPNAPRAEAIKKDNAQLAKLAANPSPH